MLGDVQNFRQPRIFITAQRRIDDVIRDDARFLCVVADFFERLHGECLCFIGGEMDSGVGYEFHVRSGSSTLFGGHAGLPREYSELFHLLFDEGREFVCRLARDEIDAPLRDDDVDEPARLQMDAVSPRFSAAPDGRAPE